MVLFFSSLILALCALCESFIKNKKAQKILLIVPVVMLVLLYSLADLPIFSDNKHYIPFFERLNNSWSKEQLFGYEIGWSLLNLGVSLLFSGNFRWLMVVVSIIIVVSYLVASKRFSPYPVLSLFLFLTLGFWGMSGTVLRQGVAMAIAMFSLKYVFDKSPIKHYLFVLLAVLFHYSSILMIVVYPLSKIKFSLPYFITLIVAFVSIFLFGERSIDLINNWFNKNYVLDANVNYLLIAGIIGVSLFEVIYTKKFYPDDGKMHLFCHMTMLASVLTAMSIFNYSFIRLSYYFLVVQIFLIPIILSKFNDKNRILLTLLVIGVSIFFYSVIIEFNSGAMLPYSFFW